jgi:hypothetical protein
MHVIQIHGLRAIWGGLTGFHCEMPYGVCGVHGEQKCCELYRDVCSQKSKKMKFLLLCLFMAMVSVLADEKSHRCRELDKFHASGQKEEVDVCLNACRGNEHIIECLRSVEIFQNSFGVWQWRWLGKSAENTKPPVDRGGFTCTKVKEPVTVSHCADGWKGDRCDEPMTVSHCADGWKGDRCDEPASVSDCADGRKGTFVYSV